MTSFLPNGRWLVSPQKDHAGQCDGYQFTRMKGQATAYRRSSKSEAAACPFLAGFKHMARLGFMQSPAFNRGQLPGFRRGRNQGRMEP